MKTADLIDLLAAGAGAVPRAAVARRFAPALAAAFLVSVTLALAALGPVPSDMLSGAALWIKLGYAAALALSCAWLAARLARPSAPILAASSWVVAVVSAMALVGVLALASMPQPERPAYLLGRTAARCPWIILALSLPALIGMTWALRGLAPTRLHLTGLAAGLLAGAVGAAAYALSCDEQSIAFIALWYSLGIALSGAAGSALAGRVPALVSRRPARMYPSVVARRVLSWSGAPPRRHTAAIAVTAMLPLATAFAIEEHYLKDGTAASGYDVVAYHTVGTPTLGSGQFASEYQGVTWRFASAGNRDLFAADPAKYAPAYGGRCSVGASKGKKVATKPEFWKIVDGQLYLNSTEGARKGFFLADTANVIRKGEATQENSSLIRRTLHGRGRDGDCSPPPPAQIPSSGFPAAGSSPG